MIFSYEEFDLSGIKTYPLKSRKSKISVQDLARPGERGMTVGGLLRSLPNVLAAADLKTVPFDVLSIASNHTGEMGPEAVEDTAEYHVADRLDRSEITKGDSRYPHGSGRVGACCHV